MTKLSKKAPNYLPIAKITEMPFDYEWDSEFPFSLIDQGSFETIRKLEKLSNRGLIAYSTGCGEWTVYRMSKVVDDLLPYYYIEAFWAYVMGKQDLFKYPPELDHEEWGGYEKGPIDCAISSIMNVIYLYEFYDPPVSDAARIAELAKHVLGDETLFLEWERKVLDRLVKNCPRIEDEPEGEPIYRQLMDVSSEYNEHSRDQLIEMNFEGKDFSDNPFFIKGLTSD